MPHTPVRSTDQRTSNRPDSVPIPLVNLPGIWVQAPLRSGTALSGPRRTRPLHRTMLIEVVAQVHDLYLRLGSAPVASVVYRQHLALLGV